MPYASILVKNVSPVPNDTFIPLTTVFKFEILPYNGAVINISTLRTTVTVSGGTTGMTRRFELEYDDRSIKYVGTPEKGYSVSVDLFPDFSLNFDSGETIQLRINASDTDGNEMRMVVLNYVALDIEMYDAFSDLIREVTEVSSDYEQGRLNVDGSEADFTHKNWSLNIEPKVYVNDILQSSGYTVDKVNGKIIFDTPLRTGDISGYGYVTGRDDFFDVVDRVNVDYKFSAFSDVEMVNFMRTALGMFNGSRPQSSFTLRGAPIYAKGAILLGAAYYAMNFLLLGLVNQQFRVIWGEEEWGNIVGPITTLKENYKSQFEKLVEEKRYKLAKIASVVQVEFSLAGGRSRFFRYLYKEGGSM